MLYQHQKKIIQADPKKCGLFLSVGTGKTRIALHLARGRTLIIAPKTQIEDGNWPREFNKIGKENLKIKGIWTISKEMFRRDHATLQAFDTVIVDEAETCLGVTPNIRWRKKQPVPKASQLFEALESYLERTKPSRLYLCTATIVRSAMTVWAAARLLGKKFDFYKFRDRFYVRLPMPFREVYAPVTKDAVKTYLAKVVRSIGYVGRLDDYFDVPEQTWKTDSIELTAEQTARIKALRFEYPDPLVLLGKQHQVENGILTGDQFNKAESFKNGKIDKIIGYTIQFPRIVIFAKYRAQIHNIEHALTTFDKRLTVMKMTGETKDRGALLKQAATLKRCVFICQAQISAGWELKEFPVMIFASRTHSYTDYQQAIGRIQRADNIKKNLYIKLVVRNGVDAAIDKSLENKQDFDEKLYVQNI